MTLDDTEAGVLAGCLQLLKLRGIPAYRSDAARRGGPARLPAGCPDITAILPALKDGRRGVYCGIECKRPVGPRASRGGRIRPGQRAFGERVEAAGGFWLFVYDVRAFSDWLDANLDPSYHRPADYEPT